MSVDEVVIRDRRQSPTAAAVQRGVCRALRAAGYATLAEFPLASGRRADLIAVDPKGMVLIVEIKSSVADFRADRKWPDYWSHCDRLYFAVADDMPREVLPQDAGLIVADAWDAEFLRHPTPRPLSAARRKALTLQFARAAAHRLQLIHDPHAMEAQPGF